jgi:hypothetical protein
MHSGRIAAALAGALAVTLFVQGLLSSRQKSPVFDEIAHIGAALSYAQFGVFRLNPEHPPLLKELAGLSMLAGGVRWPAHPLAKQALAEGGELEWDAGRLILEQDGPDRALAWARLPMMMLAAGLAVLLFFWGRSVIGAWPAVGAVLLYVLDPNIVAHSYLVTTDVGLAAFALLYIFALWHYVQRPGWKRMLWCGLALGAALLTKFSALFLLPITVLLLLAAARWPVEKAGKPVARRPSGIAALANHFWAFCGMLAVAGVVICAGYLSPFGVFSYMDGAGRVNANHISAHLPILAGNAAPRFLLYFVAAYFLKVPLASCALTLTGLIVLVRARPSDPLRTSFLLIPPAVLLAAYSLWADDIGIRYIIPVLPFAYLLGGLGLAELALAAARWRRALAGVLALWLVVAAVGIYPDHLSYFNELAALLSDPSQLGWDGGTRCGTLWMGDSNVDWGQSVKQLKSWLDEHAAGRPVQIADFGPFSPRAYGIQYTPVTAEGLERRPAPGLYVVSGALIARYLVFSPAGSAHWTRTIKPTAIVGHALYVYDIPARQ